MDDLDDDDENADVIHAMQLPATTSHTQSSGSTGLFLMKS